ncbi:MAG: replication-associated recombination protein A [Gammaproteobacteria bacterium]|nr:replication-associated recombination protein A [Gammaproteobacteria bacterium]
MQAHNKLDSLAPLALRLRPKVLSEFIGQEHLLSEGKPLYKAIQAGHLHSLILWGPPGVGKTTLAEIIAGSADARIERISAVLAGVKEIREVVARAKLAQQTGKATVLFVDEVHRFNKSQQDAFLPHVEQGLITLIGATTENPSFQLNNALISRSRVYVLKPLMEAELLKIIERALEDKTSGFGERSIDLALELRQQIAMAADGDARQCLNILEMLSDFTELQSGREVISATAVTDVLANNLRRFDNAGDAFYDQISALHKSVRGSNPDAALYWLTRMIDGGCDLNYLARRILRMASEDIGNADPRALQISLTAWQAYERLGSPEGDLVLAQAIVYLAVAPKSNAVYKAFNQASADVKQQGSLAVPMHLCNAPTKLMKQLGHGKGYRYAHDEPNAFAAGVNYFPEEMSAVSYYQPVSRGLEIKIKQKLQELRSLDKKAMEQVK